jgi:hypothetical protein
MIDAPPPRRPIARRMYVAIFAVAACGLGLLAWWAGGRDGRDGHDGRRETSAPVVATAPVGTSLSPLPALPNTNTQAMRRPKEESNPASKDAANVSALPPVPGSTIAEGDWSSVVASAPIPLWMPASESDDPYEAGFSEEWIIRAIEPSHNIAYNGKKSVRASDLIRRIALEPKDPTDDWAYEFERDLRAVVAERVALRAIPPRIFCNAHGCLAYFQGITDRDPMSTVGKELHTTMRATYGIPSDGVFITNGGISNNGSIESRRPYNWVMLIILRHPLD